MFLPEPDPRAVRFTVISVDDHVVEPRHTFEGRLPRRLQDRAPRVVETPSGREVWEFEGDRHYQAGMNAIVGRRRRIKRERGGRRSSPRRPRLRWRGRSGCA